MIKNVNALVGVLSLMFASQAHAIVAFSIGAIDGKDPGVAPGQVSVVTFDGANAAGVTETDGGPVGSVGLFTMTDPDVAAAPVGDISRFEAIQPGGSAKFGFTDYAPGVSSLSVYVGSIDSYNTFKVSTSLHTYTYTGSNFLNHNGDQFSHLTNRRVYFQFDPAETFKSITFSSSGIALEYDSIAVRSDSFIRPALTSSDSGLIDGDDVEMLTPSSIPEPGPWAMMLTGFALLGIGMRRRRSASAI